MTTPRQQERQNRMLESALAEFCRTGFHKANVDEIARIAGVGKGTLYRHYENKEGLFLCVFEMVIARIQAFIHERSDFKNFEKGAREAVRVYLEQIAEKPEIFHFFRIFTVDQQLPYPELRLKLTERYIESTQWVVKEIRIAQSKGVIRKAIDAEKLSFAVLGMIHFLIYDWLKKGAHESLANDADVICDIVFQGILKK
ncbi:MAG: TetR/AcrR family transcriptional regulator [Candidatus Ozemobacteraceae bacterium]